MKHLVEPLLRYIADMPRYAVAGIAGGLIVLAFGGGAYVVYVQKSAAISNVATIATSTPSSTSSPAGPSTQSPTQPATPVLYQAPVASAARLSTLPQLPPGTCRLPLAYVSEANGGFIIYPGGLYQPDSTSEVALPGNTPGQVGVNAGVTYDFVIGVWVPVPNHWLAPGGQTYVYEDYKSGTIHAVTVATGESGLVSTDGGWQLIGTTDDGVFASKANASGAWFIPFGRQAQQIVDHGTWQRYGNSALWGSDSSNKLVRYDTSTGAETTWGSITSYGYIVGFDALGEPVVATGGAQVLHHGDGSTTTIWAGTNGLVSSGYVSGDAHGIWFEVDGSGRRKEERRAFPMKQPCT